MTFPAPMRNWQTNPINPRCPIHLRRVCGTCQHFGADAIRTRATCAKTAEVRAGGADAAHCQDWTRKVVEAAQ